MEWVSASPLRTMTVEDASGPARGLGAAICPSRAPEGTRANGVHALAPAMLEEVDRGSLPSEEESSKRAAAPRVVGPSGETESTRGWEDEDFLSVVDEASRVGVLPSAPKVVEAARPEAGGASAAEPKPQARASTSSKTKAGPRAARSLPPPPMIGTMPRARAATPMPRPMKPTSATVVERPMAVAPRSAPAPRDRTAPAMPAPVGRGSAIDVPALAPSRTSPAPAPPAASAPAPASARGSVPTGLSRSREAAASYPAPASAPPTARSGELVAPRTDELDEPRLTPPRTAASTMPGP